MQNRRRDVSMCPLLLGRHAIQRYRNDDLIGRDTVLAVTLPATSVRSCAGRRPAVLRASPIYRASETFPVVSIRAPLVQGLMSSPSVEQLLAQEPETWLEWWE